MDKKRLLCSGLALIASLCFLVPLFADEGQEGASGKRAPLIAPSGERIASSVPGGPCDSAGKRRSLLTEAISSPLPRGIDG